MKSIAGMLLIISIIFSAGCGKSDKQQGDANKNDMKADSRYVTAKGGLRLRDKPDTAGAVLVTIPEGDRVDLIEETGNSMTITGATGRWSKIKWKDKTGWGFGGYLSGAVKTSGGMALPAALLKTYHATGPVMAGSAPSRIKLDKKIIAKYYGGSMSSHSYCIIDSIEVMNNKYSILCSPRNPTDAESKEYALEGNAEKIKNMIITSEPQGNITSEGTLYKLGSGL